MTPRKVAALGLLAGLAGTAFDVGLVLAGGRGLTGAYWAGTIGLYTFYAVIAVIALGAALAAGAGRSAGVTLMYIAALFQVGYLVGSQLSLAFLILPARP
jgi:hypothetical protein